MKFGEKVYIISGNFYGNLGVVQDYIHSMNKYVVTIIGGKDVLVALDEMVKLKN